MNALRSILYLVARLLGDVNAARRGPAAIGKRIARKAAGRAFGSIIGRIIK